MIDRYDLPIKIRDDYAIRYTRENGLYSLLCIIKFCRARFDPLLEVLCMLPQARQQVDILN